MANETNVSNEKKNFAPEGFTVLTGRINAINKPDGDYDYYVLGGKAVDAYSMPPVNQISHLRTARALGRVGDEVTLELKVGGFPRKSKDGTITFINNTLSTIAD